MTKKYHNEHTQGIHEWATYAFKAGRITKERMKEYDDICLVKEKKQTAKQTRQARVSVKQTQLEQTA